MTRLDVDLRIAAGDSVVEVLAAFDGMALGVFGPSGAGKTTFVEAVAGLREAEGTLRFQGETWNDSRAGVFTPPERRRVGWVPQDGLLFPHLDVLANVVSGRGAEAGTDWQTRVVDLLELKTLLARMPSELSGGERQRVALARALCGRPRLLLLDEPLASLDRERRNQILPFLRQVRERLEVPMILVSHEAVEIQSTCEEVLLIEGGRVIEQGPAADVLSRPGRIQDALGFENVLPGTVVEAAGATAEVEIAPGVVVEVHAGAVSRGDSVMIAFAAQQVMISLAEPQGLSARNVLRAEVRAVEVGSGQVLVHATLQGHDCEVVAEVTRQSVDDLDLVSGRPVWMVFKTSGCRVLG